MLLVCNTMIAEENVDNLRLTEILNLFQLEQVITDPTRVTSTRESLLDIATNRPDKLLNSGVLHIGDQ